MCTTSWQDAGSLTLIEKANTVKGWRTNKVAQALSMDAFDSPGNPLRSKCM